MFSSVVFVCISLAECLCEALRVADFIGFRLSLYSFLYFQAVTYFVPIFGVQRCNLLIWTSVAMQIIKMATRYQGQGISRLRLALLLIQLFVGH